jgi:hypothetical protein
MLPDSVPSVEDIHTPSFASAGFADEQQDPDAFPPDEPLTDAELDELAAREQEAREALPFRESA